MSAEGDTHPEAIAGHELWRYVCSVKTMMSFLVF